MASTPFQEGWTEHFDSHRQFWILDFLPTTPIILIREHTASWGPKLWHEQAFLSQWNQEEREVWFLISFQRVKIHCAWNTSCWQGSGDWPISAPVWGDQSRLVTNTDPGARHFNMWEIFLSVRPWEFRCGMGVKVEGGWRQGKKESQLSQDLEYPSSERSLTT